MLVKAGPILDMRPANERHTHVFTIYVIPSHGHAKDNWHPSSYKTSTYLFYIVNIMVADVLAT